MLLCLAWGHATPCMLLTFVEFVTSLYPKYICTYVVINALHGGHTHIRTYEHTYVLISQTKAISRNEVYPSLMLGF